MFTEVSCENYARGVHGTVVTIGELTIWFSYRTPIAFHTPDTGQVVRQNEWGPTTGGHITACELGDKSARIPGGEFCNRLARVLPGVDVPA